MSISTASISSRFCCSGSSGMRSTVTPRTKKGSNHPRTKADVLQKNEDAKEAWRHEIAGRINVLDDDSDTIEDYLTTYVPSIVPYQPPTVKNAKTSAFAKWSPKKGEERQSYPELVSRWLQAVGIFSILTPSTDSWPSITGYRLPQE